MPRRRFSRRRFRSRRGRRPRARRLVKLIKRTIKRSTEVKYSVTTATDQTITAGSWSLTNISPVTSQGVTIGTRIGNHIQLKRLTFNLNLENIGLGAGLSTSGLLQRYRIVIIQPRVPNPVIADLLFSTSMTNSTIHTGLMPSGCRVIKDWKGIIATKSLVTATNSNAMNMPVAVYKRTSIRMPYKVSYRLNSTTTVEEPKDQTWLLIGLTGDVVQNTGLVSSTHKYSFIDL